MTVTYSTPNVLATQPAGNVAASLLDANWAAAQSALSGVVASMADLLIAHDFTGTQAFGKGVNLASGATLNLGSDGNYFVVTGTTGITAISAKQAGCLVFLRFAGILTLTNSATLILPGGTNATTVANDVWLALSDGGGTWRLFLLTRTPSGESGVWTADLGPLGAATRAANTEYQNLSGVKRRVLVTGAPTGGTLQYSFLCDAASPVATTRAVISLAATAPVLSLPQIDIPSNWYYRVTVTTGTILTWFELDE